jgi:hypothetical protein
MLRVGRTPAKKGKRWEREAANNLTKGEGQWKRVPGSGALGSRIGDASLKGDAVGRYPWWRRPFRAEAKYGYGTSRQMQLQRAWVQKIRDQSKGSDSLPCLLLKFKNVTTGDPSAKLIVFDFETWNKMMDSLAELWEEHLKLLEAEYERNK